MTDMFKELVVVKRSGQRVSFNGTKVAIAIDKGFESVYDKYDVKDVNKVYEEVLKTISNDYKDRKTINVEDIQNIIETCLQKLKYMDVYQSFSDYRLRRARSREVFEIKSQHKFLKAIEKVGYLARSANDKKPNEMIDRFAKIISKEFATSYLIEGKVQKGLEEGIIYLNDLRNYSIGNTSSAHLNINFENIINTNSFINEIIKVIILVKQDQYREHTLMNFDTLLKPKLLNDYKRVLLEEFNNSLKVFGIDTFINKNIIKEKIKQIDNIEDKHFLDSELTNDVLKNIFNISYSNTINRLNKLLKNNFEKLFSILESSISSSYKKLIICLDNDNTFIGNLIVSNYLDSLIVSDKILTNIYINEIDNEINNKIFLMSKTHHINFLLEDDKSITYFSNGERIYENINGHSSSKGRCINSTSTINLARIALQNNNLKDFLTELDNIMELNKNALLGRYEVQANKVKENYNVLFNKGLLDDADKLEDNQKVRKILRNGAFIMGFTGLSEAVFLLTDKQDNNLTDVEFSLILKIAKAIKSKCEKITEELKLNFVPAEIYDDEVNRKLIQIDKSVFGIKKIINKPKYEPLYKFINACKGSLEEKIDMLSQYQNIVSSIATIKVKKDIDYKKYLKLIETMKKAKIKYGVLDYDN